MRSPILVFTSVGFGAVSAVIAMVLGGIVTSATGIPLAGGLLNGILTAAVLTIGLISTRYLGSATVMWIVFAGVASMSTTLGPAGVYKIAIGAIAGIIWDAVYQILKKSRWGLYIGALLGSASIMFTLVGALSLGFGEDFATALQKYKEAFYFIIAINLLVTIVGVYLGETIFVHRLSKLSSFRNLSRHAS